MILKCYETQLSETINVNTFLSFIFNRTLSSLHLNCINKMSLPAPNLPPYCVYFFWTLFFSLSFFPSGIYLRCLCLSLSFLLLSISLSTMELFQHQSSSLRGNKRACQLQIDYSLRQRVQTPSLLVSPSSITDNPLSLFFSLSLNLHPHLYLSLFFLFFSHLFCPFFTLLNNNKFI